MRETKTLLNHPIHADQGTMNGKIEGWVKLCALFLHKNQVRHHPPFRIEYRVLHTEFENHLGESDEIIFIYPDDRMHNIMQKTEGELF